MIRQLFLLSFILFLGCQNKNQSPDAIQQGSIAHDSLTRDQLKDIQFLFETFKEVDSAKYDKWIEDFKRDKNPDNEIQIWMAMANAYNSYCQNRKLNREMKMEVYQIIVMRSTEPEDEVLSQLNLRFLSQKDAIEVMQGYTLDAKPVR
ncbi:MAG TPA: hypothetical protein VIM65_14710 [Cyclobacteriaceae bacterium]